MKKNLLLAFAAACSISSFAKADATAVQPSDLIAICGDSITEQKIYSVDMEDYLLMCKPVPGARAEQFGWSGETSWGFLDKMPNYMLPFKATVATTCYGMNDGAYSPMTDDKARRYRQAQTDIVEKLKASGVHLIVLGSPGAVDSDTFRKDPTQAAMYNQTLGALRDIDRDIARKEGVTFADVHQTMLDVMARAKARYGKEYVFAGPDGVHPTPNGHLVMAYAYLKALGFDGNIGTITVDLAAHKADATDGHKVTSVHGDKITIESTRYPICFTGDPAQSTTASIIEFLPFNQELNRFTLVVNNAGADKLKVTWGDQSKEFSAAALAKGINLAAEFLTNPFSEPFAKYQAVIQAKQAQETALDKGLYFPLSQQHTALPEASDSIEKIRSIIETKLADAATKDRGGVPVVTHTITIKPVK